MRDRAIWKTAPPLWRDALAGTVDLDRPALLRFDSDDFIERLQANLDDAEARNVGSFALRDETWKDPKAGLSVPAGSDVPRLYQPIHRRHYLVAGGLVCRSYGLPDKALHPNCDESAFFVLRRLQRTNDSPVDPEDRTTFHEFGWVPSGQAGSWAAVGDGLAPGEQHLPLFPMTYVDGRRRRVLAGTIPVAARERYEGSLPPDPVPSNGDPAAVLAQPDRDRLFSVALGFESLLAAYSRRPQDEARRKTFDAHFLEAWFFALVDLAGFLAIDLEGVLRGTDRTSREQVLAKKLESAVFRDDGHPGNWLAALSSARINSTTPSGPPAPVAGMSAEGVLTAYSGLGLSETEPPAAGNRVFIIVNAALPDPPQAVGGAQAKPQAPAQPDRKAGSVYVTRLVYERPRCAEPDRLTVSAPSEPFRLAHFYDPDAPFRDQQLVLPVDTSLTGLRKFPRAVKVELSAHLRKQVERVQAVKLDDLDSGEIPPEGPGNLGLICSLSIPIITICALMLLMIIVSLLNIVFFWVPLFKICLPKAGD
jgi:hypothetical protein